MDHLLAVLLPIILLLGMGVVAAVASRALGLSPIVGYIVLGVALAASGMNLHPSAQTISVLAELGVLFLLFDIGLHFSFRQMKRQASDIFGFGTAQVVFCAAMLGGVAMLFGLPPAASALLGVTLALSSTAVVVPLIAERRQQQCPVGLTATSILIFQDLAGIIVLIVASTLGADATPLASIAAALGKTVACFAGAMTVSLIVVRPLLHLVARSRSDEVFTAVALLVALSAGWFTGTIGLSVTLGAFLGGAMLADSPYRSIIQSEAQPFRGLLLGFFFVSVGLALDPAILLHQWPLVLLTLGGLMAVKVVANVLASLVFRWSVPGSLQLGFLLAQGSEFAFVILSLSPVRALVGTAPTSVLVAALALGLAVTPNVAMLGRWLAGTLRRQRADVAAHELQPKAVLAPVLILGMGEVGRAVADALIHFDIGYAAMEAQEALLRNAIADGYSVEFGDLIDPRIWEPMSLAGRKVTLLTEPSLEIATRLSPLARQYFPDVLRIAVVTGTAQAVAFASAGLEPVVEEGEAPGRATALRVLQALNVPSDAIATWAADHWRSRATATILGRPAPLAETIV